MATKRLLAAAVAAAAAAAGAPRQQADGVLVMAVLPAAGQQARAVATGRRSDAASTARLNRATVASDQPVIVVAVDSITRLKTHLSVAERPQTTKLAQLHAHTELCRQVEQSVSCVRLSVVSGGSVV